MKLPLPVYRALKRLNNCGFRAYIVGGSVRDMLIGREPIDYDITTNALPEQVRAIFSDVSVIPTGLKHGTVTVFIEDEPIEITTHRTEGAYSDRRHPDFINFTERLEDDLARRDLTINAIAYSPETGLIDPFGGIADISSKLIRAVGDPMLRFSEDALRIVRAVRFAAQLGFKIDDRTAEAMDKCTPLISDISAERISAELIKAISAPHMEEAFLKYRSVIFQVVPMCAKLAEAEYAHNVKTASGLPPKAHIRLAALLHERSAKATPLVTHNALLAMKALKLDNNTIGKTVTLIRNYDYPFLADRKNVRMAFYHLTPDAAIELLSIRRADMLADGISASGCAYIDEIVKLALEVAASDDCFSLDRLNFSGNDAIALGANGRQIKLVLELAMRAVISEKCENDREAIAAYLRSLMH